MNRVLLGILCGISLDAIDRSMVLFGKSSTHLLNEYSRYRTSLLCYWANILILGFSLYLSWGYATRARLVKQDIPPSRRRRRILIARSLYAFGALLCGQRLFEHRLYRASAARLRDQLAVQEEEMSAWTLALFSISAHFKEVVGVTQRYSAALGAGPSSQTRALRRRQTSFPRAEGGPREPS